MIDALNLVHEQAICFNVHAGTRHSAGPEVLGLLPGMGRDVALADRGCVLTVAGTMHDVLVEQWSGRTRPRHSRLSGARSFTDMPMTVLPALGRVLGMKHDFGTNARWREIRRARLTVDAVCGRLGDHDACMRRALIPMPSPTDPELTSVDFVAHHDHGILVVEPLGSRAEHEDWDGSAQGAHLEAGSLFVAVLPSMEGTVTTSVRSISEPVPPSEGLERVFEGRLDVPSRVLLIGDSDRNVEIRLPMRSGAVDVSVSVDEVGFASRARVVLREIDALGTASVF